MALFAGTPLHKRGREQRARRIETERTDRGERREEERSRDLGREKRKLPVPYDQSGYASALERMKRRRESEESGEAVHSPPQSHPVAGLAITHGQLSTFGSSLDLLA
jgi:hypothetical protein